MIKLSKYILLSCAAIIFWTGCKEEEETIVVVKNDNTYIPAVVRPILEDQQRKAFNYFFDGAEPVSGLAREGNDRGDNGVVTIGGGGFGVMALIVGAERGWISREQAVAQTLKTVRFLDTCERFEGMFSHWYNNDGTAHPFGNQVRTGDVIESGFMVAGLLTASEYYTKSSDTETEIRTTIDRIWNSIDWRHYTAGGNVLKWLWYSDENRFDLDIRGWHEGWTCYLFALAAPEPHNISLDVYENGWLSNGGIHRPNRKFYGYELPMGEDFGGPLFFAHYSCLGLDTRKIEDKYTHYWKQNVAHTMINRHYCIEEAPKNYKYSERQWGLTACYGARPPKFDYNARHPRNDDGVMAPTAALGSFPYTPFYSTQVLMNIASNSFLQGAYGPVDSYCPETNTVEKKHLAIDQGPIVVMIENYRSGLIWNLMMRNTHVKKGLQLAGVKEKPSFKEGFHMAMVNTKTQLFDMMMHPDREVYELEYFVDNGGETVFVINDKTDKAVFTKRVTALSGENTLSFAEESIMRGKSYTITMKTAAGKSYTLPVCLR